MGGTSPGSGTVALRLKPQLINGSGLGPHTLSIFLCAMGFLLKTPFALIDTETALRHLFFLSVTTQVCISTELGNLAMMVVSNSCRPCKSDNPSLKAVVASQMITFHFGKVPLL